MAPGVPATILPAEKTIPRVLLELLCVLIYGPSKIGKSTWAAQIKDALFLATEPGLNALEVFQVPIRSWSDLLAVCAELERGDHPFRVIVIDTIDNLHRLAADHVRDRLSVQHEADAGYGKGFGLINDELHRVLTKLAFLPYGLVLVSHSEEREIQTRTGKVSRTVPSLPEKTRKLVLALVDQILFVDFEDGPTTRRVIRTKTNPRYEAGDRTGRLPETLDLDFHKFMAALTGSAGEGE
ncbi:MAG: hypothetical protein DHS20C21_07250 [Gemmatimonadota bacterium]|nr:MAG: hypothetical protein DHS20C21_07250 [Gemmatimonadota bacterium]